jgi:DNA-directed RNA polymerase sigma subunit (sigma70/sigma32)
LSLPGDKRVTASDTERIAERLVRWWNDHPTCALDVAEERKGITLEEIGQLMALTRERVRQIEEQAIRKVRRQMIFLWSGNAQ